MNSSGPRTFHNLSDNLPGTDKGMIWTFDAVEERLVEAMQVLWRMPDRERQFLTSGRRATWPQIVRSRDEIADAAPDDGRVRPGPVMRREQAQMEEALAWLDYVPAGPGRTVIGEGVAQLAYGYSRISWQHVWADMGGQAGGWTVEGLRKRYTRSIAMICARLNAAKSCI